MIQVSGLVKIYPPSCKAVAGIDLHVEKGEIIGILGPNGAGKTTMIRVLTTLANFNSGTVSVAGYDVKKEAAKVRKIIGYVAQETGIDYFLTGRENLVLQGHLYRMKNADIKVRVEQLASYFDLTSSMDQLVSTYSGGMRRKLDIATALIHNPSILFLDEPTLGLDIKSRQALWNLIRKLNKEFDLTIVLTTHYLEEADKLARRVVIINDGLVKVVGTPDELKNSISGDSLIMEFEQVDQVVKAATDRLNDESYVKSVVWDGDTLHLYVENGGEAVPKVMIQYSSQNIDIKTLSLSRPTLDDVFLKYTGTSMIETKEDTGDEWWMQWAGKGGGGNWGKWQSEDDESSSGSEPDRQEGKWSPEEMAQWQASQEEKKDSETGEAPAAVESPASKDEPSDESSNGSSESGWQEGKWSPEEIKQWQASQAKKKSE